MAWKSHRSPRLRQTGALIDSQEYATKREWLRGEEGFAGWEIVAEPWFETPARFAELVRGMCVLER